MKCYKILKGTETYKKLCALWDKMQSVRDEAEKLCKELGGEEFATSNQSAHMAGGIGAIQFKEKPEGWKMVGQSWQKLYMPKADQKKMWEKINALPTVEYKELNDIVGFGGSQGVCTDGGLAWVKCPGMMKGKNLFLMGVTKGAKYTPPNKDFIEITGSEYEKIEKLIQKADKKKEEA